MSGVASRLLYGALAGLAATAAMTAAMDRMHRRLPGPERYPLPPLEITTQLAPGLRDERGHATDVAMAAHFGFGGMAGAAIAGLRVPARPLPGALVGLAVWAGSYFGWVPLFGILRPAWNHPARRNALMAGAHVVWGVATALVLNELYRARGGMLAVGPARDI